MTAEREGLAEIAGVLAEHSGCTVNDGEISAADTAVDVWSCGLRVPYEEDFGDAERAHYAHALADLLAARDRRVRAETLREAAGEVRDRTLTPAIEGAQPKKWLDGERFGRHIAAVVLRDRADRIEADA